MYADNFGRLHEFTFEFEDGLNVILEENGWGKTTMAAFLKAMLYGFEPGAFDTERDRERKQYKPWQGGNYGGWLEFEVNGKTYRVTRTFGDNLKGDTVKVIDIATGNEAPFNAERLGESLFHLDAGAFERSVFIPQNDLLAENTNDGIQARLSSLISKVNDADTYGKASGDLNQKIRAFERADSRGEIEHLNWSLTEKAAEKQEIDRSITKQKELRSNLYMVDDSIRKANQFIQLLNEKHDEEVRTIEKRNTSKDHMRKLNDEIDDHNSKQQNLKDALGGDVPTLKQLEDSRVERETLKTETEQFDRDAEQRTQLYADLTQIMTRFHNQLPNEAKLEEISAADKDLHGVEFAIEQEDKRFEEIEVPEGYSLVQKATEEDASYLDSLKEAVALQEPMRALTTKAQIRNSEIHGEEDSWKNIQRGYQGLHEVVIRTEETFEGMKGYSPEETAPDIQGLDDLKNRETVLMNEASELLPLIEKEDNDFIETRKNYQLLHARSAKLNNTLSKNDIYSSEHIEPVIEEIEALETLQNEVMDRQEIIWNNVLTDEEKKILKENAGELPEEKDVQEKKALYRDLQEKEVYRNSTSAKLNTEKGWASNHTQTIKDIDQAISDLPDPGDEPSMGAGIALLLIGALAVAAGAVLAYRVMLQYALISVTGIAFIVIGGFLLNRIGSARVVYRSELDDYNSKKAEKEKEKATIQGELDTLEKEINTLSTDLEQTEGQITKGNTELNDWVRKYGKNDSEVSEAEITKIGENAVKVRALREKEKLITENETFINENNGHIKRELNRIAGTYRVIRGMDVSESLNMLRHSEEEFEKLQERCNQALEEEGTFLAGCGFREDVLKGETPVLPSEARKRYEHVKKNLEDVGKTRSQIDEKYQGIANLGYDAAAQELTGRTEKYIAAKEQMDNALKAEAKYLEDVGQTQETIVKPESPKHDELMNEKANDEKEFEKLLQQALTAMMPLGLEFNEGDNLFALMTKGELYLKEYERYDSAKKEYLANIAGLNQTRAAKARDLNNRMEVLNGIYEGLPVTERLAKIHADRATAIRLAESIKEIDARSDKLRESRKKKVESIAKFDNTYGYLMSPGDDVFEQISERTISYWKHGDSREALQRQADELKSEINRIPSDIDETEQDTARKIMELEERKNLILVERSKADARIREIDHMLENYPKLLNSITELVEEKEKAVNELRLLRKTSNILRQARENLSGRYYNRVEETFNNYMKVWLDSELFRGIIDENLNVSIQENGMTREVDRYSTGYYDLIDFCMRMALVDTLFENEKPFLILDDPFVNLDADRLEGAMELLNAMASVHQIVYFVCHPVRAREAGADPVRKEEFRMLAAKTADVQSRDKASRNSTGRKADFGNAIYQLSGTPAPFAPEDPQYVIRDQEFRLRFVMTDTENKQSNRTYELFFVDEEGSVISNRKIMDLNHNELLPENIKFRINLTEPIAGRADLLVKRATSDDFEIEARFPFRIVLKLPS